MSGYAAIGIHSPKCEANIGGALRAAFVFKAKLVVLAQTRYKHQLTDTYKTFRQIPLIETTSLLSIIPHDCVPIAVEITDNAKSIVSYKHPKRAYYLFGPEDGSLPNEIISKCRDTIKIPGDFCLNLAQAVNIVLYDREAKNETQT